MRKWRRFDVRGVSKVLGGGFAYLFKAVAWVVVFVIDHLLGLVRRDDVGDDSPKMRNVVANKVFDVSCAVFEFLWRCVLWFAINIVGAMIVGLVLYLVGFIALMFALVFGGNRNGTTTIIEEYYYY